MPARSRSFKRSPDSLRAPGSAVPERSFAAPRVHTDATPGLAHSFERLEAPAGAAAPRPSFLQLTSADPEGKRLPSAAANLPGRAGGPSRGVAPDPARSEHPRGCCCGACAPRASPLQRRSPAAPSRNDPRSPTEAAQDRAAAEGETGPAPDLPPGTAPVLQRMNPALIAAYAPLSNNHTVVDINTMDRPGWYGAGILSALGVPDPPAVCPVCGSTGPFQLDHMNPWRPYCAVSLGATTAPHYLVKAAYNDPDNLWWICQTCNSGKSNKVADTGAQLGQGEGGDFSGQPRALGKHNIGMLF